MLFFNLKKEKKKWNSVFIILQIPYKFQQNWPKKVAVGLSGLQLYIFLPSPGSSSNNTVIHPYFLHTHPFLLCFIVLLMNIFYRFTFYFLRCFLLLSFLFLSFLIFTFLKFVHFSCPFSCSLMDPSFERLQEKSPLSSLSLIVNLLKLVHLLLVPSNALHIVSYYRVF